MRVQWIDIPRPGVWYPLLQFKKDTPIRARLCPNRSTWRATWLHWANDLRKTIPCTQDDTCDWCPSPVRAITYVPCMALERLATKWIKAILPVQESMVGLLELDHFRICVDMVRRGKENSRVRWEHHPATGDMPLCTGFDVQDSLFRCWGVRVDPNDARALRPELCEETKSRGSQEASEAAEGPQVTS